MKQHIARALLVAVTLVAACGDQYSAPTTPSTSTPRRLRPRSRRIPAPPRRSRSASASASTAQRAASRSAPSSSRAAARTIPRTASATRFGDTKTDVHSGGGFRCIDGVGQGPLNNCLTGEGVRWDTVQLLASAPSSAPRPTR